MFLIVGLGNPGKKYDKTRHNLGFRIINELAGKNNFPDFALSKKSRSLISEGILDGKKILLAKPQTFMNESGKAIKKITKNLEIENLFAVHDDIDLPLGKIRISIDRSSGGHKGVESIIKELGNKNFIRFRIGIKPLKIENGKRKTENFVLQKFTKEEEKILEEIIKKAAEAIDFLLKEGLEKAMTKFN